MWAFLLLRRKEETKREPEKARDERTTLGRLRENTRPDTEGLNGEERDESISLSRGKKFPVKEDLSKQTTRGIERGEKNAADSISSRSPKGRGRRCLLEKEGRRTGEKRETLKENGGESQMVEKGIKRQKEKEGKRTRRHEAKEGYPCLSRSTARPLRIRIPRQFGGKGREDALKEENGYFT